MDFVDESLQGEMEKFFVAIVASLRATYMGSYSCSLFIPSFWIEILTKQMPWKQKIQHLRLAVQQAT